VAVKDGVEISQPATINSTYYWEYLDMEEHVLTHAFQPRSKPLTIPFEYQVVIGAIIGVAATATAPGYFVKKKKKASTTATDRSTSSLVPYL